VRGQEATLKETNESVTCFEANQNSVPVFLPEARAVSNQLGFHRLRRKDQDRFLAEFTQFKAAGGGGCSLIYDFSTKAGRRGMLEPLSIHSMSEPLPINSSKEELYSALIQQIEAVIADTDDLIANLVQPPVEIGDRRATGAQRLHTTHSRHRQ
jgi:hypothetical protein